MVKGLALKLRTCAGCQLYFVENKEDEVSRKIRRAKCLCGNCLSSYDKYKQERNVPPLTYLGEYEPIPFNADIDHTQN